MFRIIDGGRISPTSTAPNDIVRQVLEEGRKRLLEAGVLRCEVIERLTGQPMPADAKRFKVQIEFAMSALSSLNPLPSDYRDNGYWPSMNTPAILSSVMEHEG